MCVFKYINVLYIYLHILVYTHIDIYVCVCVYIYNADPCRYIHTQTSSCFPVCFLKVFCLVLLGCDSLGLGL